MGLLHVVEWHKDGRIYSRIDHAFGNVNSDHSPIKVNLPNHVHITKYQFKYLNSITECEDFVDKIAQSGNDMHIEGRPMYVLWRKLHMLKLVTKQI